METYQSSNKLVLEQEQLFATITNSATPITQMESKLET